MYTLELAQNNLINVNVSVSVGIVPTKETTLTRELIILDLEHNL